MGGYPGLIVARATTRTEALAAIDQVIQQGEGASPFDPESHFSKFISLLDRLEKVPSPVRISSLPRSPYVGDALPPEDRQHAQRITHPYTALWAHLFDSVYELVLLDIAWGMSQPTGPERATLIDLALQGMRQILRPIAKAQTRRYMNEVDSLKAGPTYGLEDDSTPATRAEYRTRYQMVLERQSTVISTLKDRPEYLGDAAGRRHMTKVGELNVKRSPYVPLEQEE